MLAMNKKPKDRRQERRQEAQWSRITQSAMTVDHDDAPQGPRNALALRRLGVTPEQLAAAPQITPLLELADGGLPTVLSAMRSSADPLIRTFLAKYDSVSVSDRARVSVEAIALAAGLDITSLLGSVMIALERQAVAVVRILTVTHHPRIVAARIKYGQLPSGDRDRTALDTAVGFLPNPKGPVFVNRIYNAGKGGMEQHRNGPGLPDDEDEPLDGEVPIAADNVDLDALFPNPSIIQEELIPIRNRLAGNQPEPDGPVPDKDRIARLLGNLPKQIN